MLILFRNLFAPPRDLILLFVAAWLGWSLAEKRTNRHGISTDALNNLIFTGTIAYILGGRVFYAAEHLSAFTNSLPSLFALNTSSFDQWGALAAALIAGFAYGQRKRLTLWSALDAMTIFFATIAIGLGFSHLASGLAFGQETKMPWAIKLWGTMRHPTQIYEIAASILTLGLLWFRKADSKPGSTFLTFIALAATSRIIIESFRGDSTLILNGLRVAQLVAWIALATSIIGLELLKPITTMPESASADIPPNETKKKASARKPRTEKSKTV
jgi:phosphatidylglycerol:prolipoprotein diacylglycerol transferase